MPVAALMSLYCTFLLFSALKSSNSNDCNSTDSGTDLAMWLGIIFALIMLCVASMRADLMEGAFDISGIKICCVGSDSIETDENAGLSTKSDTRQNVKQAGSESSDSDSDEDEENVVELGIIEDDKSHQQRLQKQKKQDKSKLGDSGANRNKQVSLGDIDAGESVSPTHGSNRKNKKNEEE